MANIIADTFTIAEHTISTEDGHHQLYVQEWGNPKGTPILYVHGGPGGGCSESVKKLFDASKHYVIFLDQRGSGRSTPYASTESNTTQLLIQDIELVLVKLNIESVILFGRSWGSTLSLCYAIEYPHRVRQIITGGIFLATTEEHEWVINGTFKHFYPEVWDRFGRDSMSVLTYARLSLPLLKLDDRYEDIDEAEFDEQFLTINVAYNNNHWYLPDNYIRDNVDKITMPVTIIQGRYDMLTPPMYAYKLHKSLPDSTLQWTIAGHSKDDRANFDATKAALAQL